MRAADSNVVLRVLLRDEDVQTAIAEAFIAGGAWVSHLVLAETLWVLARALRFDRERIAATVQMLLNHESFRIDRPTMVAAALEEYRKLSQR